MDFVPAVKRVGLSNNETMRIVLSLFNTPGGTPDISTWNFQAPVKQADDNIIAATVDVDTDLSILTISFPPGTVEGLVMCDVLTDAGIASAILCIYKLRINLEAGAGPWV